MGSTGSGPEGAEGSTGVKERIPAEVKAPTSLAWPTIVARVDLMVRLDPMEGVAATRPLWPPLRQ